MIASSEVNVFAILTIKTSNNKIITLDVTGKHNVDFFLGPMVAVVAFPLCMDVVEVMLVRMVLFLNKR